MTWTCDKCVPKSEYDELHKHFSILLVLACALLVLLAIVSVQALDWRKDLIDTQHDLDRANASLSDKSYPVFIKMGKK